MEIVAVYPYSLGMLVIGTESSFPKSADKCPEEDDVDDKDGIKGDNS
jgi:hypothetical protein